MSVDFILTNSQVRIERQYDENLDLTRLVFGGDPIVVKGWGHQNRIL